MVCRLIRIYVKIGFDLHLSKCGELAEWSKAHAWKACKGATSSRVRISCSPPFLHSLFTKSYSSCELPYVYRYNK